ncbi:MAG: efflux RND transporter periplasmic adaptor subunit [Akkermansiaceae bacterium]|nr:efflux RND transporter periplasmic adaptor subunit [Akkermansiaceae bacterium]
MKTQRMIVGMLGGLALAGLMSCEEKNQAQQPKPMDPLAVSVTKLHRQDVELESTWLGHLRGVEEANIKPEVTGKLLRQVYWDGSPCEKGEVLFEIDPSIYQAAVNLAEANVEAAKAGVQQAQAASNRVAKDVERYEKLVHTGSISEKMYTDTLQLREESTAALAVARAQVAQAEAQLATARINLERCVIRAPFAGVASKSTVSVGDFIAAGAVTLTTMSSIDPIRVDFVVPGKHMLSKALSPEFDATKGMVSPVNDFRLILEDGTEYELPGKVVAVDSYVNKTGTVNFVGHVPNPKLQLRSGSAVRVKAKTGVIKDALLVPSRALVSAMNHRFIFVVGPDSLPYGIDVQLGEEVVLEVPNGPENKPTPMLMQVITGTVKPLEESLREIGIENPDEAQIIVEGGQGAALYAQINAGMRAAGATMGFGKVVPHPFEYTHPETTTPSITTKN